MNKRYTFLLLSIVFFSVRGQVGINTTDPKALLDIPVSNISAPSNTDGILIPRVSVFPATNPTAAQNGMLVFLTTLTGTDQPGFYYWDNAETTWKAIGGTTSGGWNLNGNTATNPTTNYIGTFDGMPLSFRTTNKTRFTISALGYGQFGMNGFSDSLSDKAKLEIGAEGLEPNDFSLRYAGNDDLVLNFIRAKGTKFSSTARLTTGNEISSIRFWTLGTGGTIASTSGYAFASGIKTIMENNSGDIVAGILMHNQLGDGIYVDGSSNVGIGNTAPLAKLDISGNLRINDGTQGAGKVLTSNATGVTTWQTPAASGGILDAAYDFGGAGNGKTIIADAGALTIQGTDGLVSTGLSGTGAIMPAGNAVRMVWNPRKGAFRAGAPTTTSWDDANVGFRSVAMGASTTASGQNSTALGEFSTASGLAATVIGYNNLASQTDAFAVGNSTTASGINSTTMGNATVAPSFVETTMGRFNTTYPIGSNGATLWNLNDRLFSIGNGTSNTVRSNALTILKNGLATLPSVTNALIDAETTGKAIVTKEWIIANTGGTLDNCYDSGGSGNGKTITADSGAVTINGTDGLVCTGIANLGAITPSGDGIRMVWNPRKAAFRAGNPSLNSWDDTNVGVNSVAFGKNTKASGDNSTALGENSSASGISSFAVGFQASANALDSFASGNATFALGTASTVMGKATRAESLAETALGIYNSDYAIAPNGTLSWNATDRIFSIGNGSSPTSKSNAVTILKNGRVSLGNSSPIGQFQLSLDEGFKPGTSAWTITSDERLKIIHGKYSKGLSEIIQLNPITYNYKNVGAKTFEPEVLKTEYSGFSAQQVQQVFPEAIGTGDDGYLNLNIHPIIIASINALKELDEKNKILESENMQLRTILETQQKLLDNLLERVSTLENK